MLTRAGVRLARLRRMKAAGDTIRPWRYGIAVRHVIDRAREREERAAMEGNAKLSVIKMLMSRFDKPQEEERVVH